MPVEPLKSLRNSKAEIAIFWKARSFDKHKIKLLPPQRVELTTMSILPLD